MSLFFFRHCVYALFFFERERGIQSEDYVPPAEPKYKAFQGSGRTLGSNDSAATETPQPSEAPQSSSVREFAVDESQPMTRIQLRLPNGQRL